MTVYVDANLNGLFSVDLKYEVITSIIQEIFQKNSNQWFQTKIVLLFSLVLAAFSYRYLFRIWEDCLTILVKLIFFNSFKRAIKCHLFIMSPGEGENLPTPANKFSKLYLYLYWDQPGINIGCLFNCPPGDKWQRNCVSTHHCWKSTPTWPKEQWKRHVSLILFRIKVYPTLNGILYFFELKCTQL